MINDIKQKKTEEREERKAGQSLGVKVNRARCARTSVDPVGLGFRRHKRLIPSPTRSAFTPSLTGLGRVRVRASCWGTATRTVRAAVEYLH